MLLLLRHIDGRAKEEEGGEEFMCVRVLILCTIAFDMQCIVLSNIGLAEIIRTVHKDLR